MAKESLNVVRERLAEFLPRLSVQVKNDGKSGLNNIHKLSEPVIRNLMNIFYRLELKLETKVNAGGFDLCDTKNHVFVQVTGNCTDDKIRDCLRTTADRVAKDPELANTELYIAFLTSDTDEIKKLRKKTATKLKKGELKAEGFRFTAESGILCLQDFVQFLTDDLDPDGEELTEEQVRRIQNLLDKCTPDSQQTNLYLPFSSLGNSAFVGREDKLSELELKVREGGNDPIVVFGLGGIGKTTLVNRFCADYRSGNVYFVRFRENFTRTVAEGVAVGIPGYKDRKPDPERDYVEAMALLQQCHRDDLLVIDNADDPDDDFSKLLTDSAWAELRKLKLRLLLTTRCNVPGAIHVNKMDNQTLYQFFLNQGLHLSDAQMDDLIEAVHGHTMTVDLMARTLYRTRMKPEKLLNALRSGNLSEQHYRPVTLERNGSAEQEVIYEHLRRLFNVAEISEDARAVLRNMALLPESGMDLDILEEVLDEAEFETLNQQIDHGWLVYDQDRRFVTIHPVIRMVCQTELHPNDESCSKFLNGLWELYDRSRYNIETFLQCAQLLSRAADTLDDREAEWSLHAGVIWSDLGFAQYALRYGENAVRRLEINRPGSEALAVAYCNVGSALRDQKRHAEALSNQNIALAIMEGLPTADPFVLASILDNIGTTYGYSQNPANALTYQKLALNIRETILGPNHPLVAVSYDNVGCTYGDMGDYKQALPFHLKAIAIIEQRENIDAAIAYDNVGHIYDLMGDHRQALKYKLKALRIFKKLAYGKHPDLAASYSNVAYTYAAMNDFETALKYMQKAPDALPEGHVMLEEYRRRVVAMERLYTFQRQGISVPNPFREAK